jgi:hypothetical protein
VADKDKDEEGLGLTFILGLAVKAGIILGAALVLYYVLEAVFYNYLTKGHP